MSSQTIYEAMDIVLALLAINPSLSREELEKKYGVPHCFSLMESWLDILIIETYCFRDVDIDKRPYLIASLNIAILFVLC